MTPIPRDAWNDLVPELAARARQVARRLNMSPATRREFFESVHEKVVSEADGYDPERGSLGGWCHTVLYRHGVDVIRMQARQREGIERYVAEVESQGERHSEPAEFDDTPRPDVIGALRDHVDGLDRIVVAIDFQLLGRVDPTQVADWLAAANLPSDFPWQQIESIDKQSDRRKALVVVLAVNAGWLRQRIFRTLQKLSARMGGENA